MILNFKCSETRKIWNQVYSKKFPPKMQRSALRKLFILHRARNILDLKIPPSNHLEKLKKNRIGQMSIRINKQYRVCFKWVKNNAKDVEVTDYH